MSAEMVSVIGKLVVLPLRNGEKVFGRVSHVDYAVPPDQMSCGENPRWVAIETLDLTTGETKNSVYNCTPREGQVESTEGIKNMRPDEWERFLELFRHPLLVQKIKEKLKTVSPALGGRGA